MFRKASVAGVAALVTHSIATPRAQSSRHGLGASLECDFGSDTRALRASGAAAAVVQNARMFASGAVRTPRAGAPMPVTMDDRFPGR
jgi:hypothetical protein